MCAASLVHGPSGVRLKHRRGSTQPDRREAHEAASMLVANLIPLRSIKHNRPLHGAMVLNCKVHTGRWMVKPSSQLAPLLTFIHSIGFLLPSLMQKYPLLSSLQASQSLCCVFTLFTFGNHCFATVLVLLHHCFIDV